MTNDNLAAQIGELKGTVAALQTNFNSWMEHWSRQDQAATVSRRDLHQRFDGLSAQVGGMNGTLTSVKDDVEEMKTEIDTKVMPTIRAYDLALAQRAGMWLMGKLVWAFILAMGTVVGFTIHEGWQYFSGSKLPFPHL